MKAISEWTGADLAERQERVDAFQEALYDLVTEAIADHLPTSSVIASLLAQIQAPAEPTLHEERKELNRGTLAYIE